MRSTALAGIVLRSTAAETPEAEDSPTQRSPSTRIRVRLAPRLRSDTVVEPEPTPEPSGLKPKLPAELNLVLSEEPLTERRWITSPIDPSPVAAMSAALITWTGVWPSISAFLMREPVTWIASRRCASSPRSGCAKTAVAGTPINPAASAVCTAQLIVRMRSFIDVSPWWASGQQKRRRSGARRPKIKKM